MIRHIILTTIVAGALQAASPWLPEPGKAHVTLMYVDDTFQDYRPGAVRGRLPAAYFQRTYYTLLEYGLKSTLAVDVETGHTETEFRGAGLSGITDTLIGVRYQALRGESWVFTVRGAAIFKGNYPISATANFSPGDKASGALVSGLYGKSFAHGFFAFSELGYRWREAPVPQDFIGTAGGGSYIKGFTWTGSYQTGRSINGVDIVGNPPRFSPYFQPSQFPATKKIFGALDAGLSYRLPGGISIGSNYSKFLHGRNMGMKRVLAFSVGFTVPGRGPHFK